MVKRPALSGYAAALLCLLAVPVLMAQQEWDDHDRSGKTLAYDMAKNYLESCPPNAILFTFEDTDTYPLWYAQEVEGIRPDVRVMVSTLIGTDWYSNQLRYKINKSAPFDMTFTPEQYAGDRLNVAYYASLPGFDQNKFYDLRTILQNVVASDDKQYTQMSEDGDLIHMFPVRKFSVPVDPNVVADKSLVLAGDKLVPELQLDLGQANFILKSDLTLLSVIAANNWKRPICFTNTGSIGNLGLTRYTRLEGLVHRLVPVENPGVNNDLAYNTVLNKFEFGGAHKKNIYFDGDNRRSLNIAKGALVQVAVSLAQAGRKEEAKKLLQKYDQRVRTDNVPWAMATSQGNMHNIVTLQYLEACYLSGEMTIAKKVAAALKKDLRQQMEYYRSLGDEPMKDEQLANAAYLLMQGKGVMLSEKQQYFAQEILSSFQILQQMLQWEKQYEIKPHT